MTTPAPVLLMAWRRPDTIKEVIAALRLAAPKHVYVACDGPNPHNREEIKLVAETRRVISEQLDWGCEVSKLYSDSNRGCRLGVSQAITWFFQHVSEGIILEDDCVPHPDFFPFCSELLEYYRSDERVWCITGNNFQHGQARGRASYYFSKYPHCWGWAAWRRAWRNYSADFEFWPLWRRSTQWRELHSSEREKSRWTNVFDRVYAQQVDSWALPWMACVWKHEGLTVTPQENLVTNIGFGNNATHTKKHDAKLSIPCKSLTLAGQHPPEVKPDKCADQYVFENIFAPVRQSSGKRTTGLAEAYTKFLKRAKRVLWRRSPL